MTGRRAGATGRRAGAMARTGGYAAGPGMRVSATSIKYRP